MSREMIAMRPFLAAAAAAVLSTVGMTTVPNPAYAKPMFPLAPNCVQYGWPGDVQLRHTNGWSATFSSVGPNASGAASATHPSGQDLQGTISGGIYGHSVDFTIRWNNGAVGHYTGLVGDDSIPRGDTVDTAHPENKAKWNTVFPISCTKTADIPAPDKPVKNIGGVKVVVQAPEGVDVFDGVNVPEGTANRIGVLTNGSEVSVWGVCGDTPDQVNPSARPSQFTPNKWCRVEGAAVPTGGGFIWGHLAPR